MLHRLTPHLPRYFSKHVSKSFRSLMLSVGLMNFGLAAFLIFEPIYLFSLGYDLRHVMFFYLGVYVTYMLVLPLASRILATVGVEHSIWYSQFFLIAYLLSLYGLSHIPGLIVGSAVLLALQKLFYWPAFHIDFMSFSDSSQRGREMSSLMSVSSIVMILGPLAGGFVINFLGFPALFLMVSALFLISSIPLIRLHEIRTAEDTSYVNIVNHLREPSRRKSLLTFFGFGEELIVMVAWPIFIYVAVQNFEVVGSLVAGATLLSTLTLFLIGKKTDSAARSTLAHVGIMGYIGIWAVRALARMPGTVVIVDAISQLTKNMFFLPISAAMYDLVDQKSRVSFAIFFEQALSLGKIVAALCVIVLTLVFLDPWWPVFLLAGAFTLFYLNMRYGRVTERKA